MLTKVDITGPVRTNEWTRFLKDKYPHYPIVRVESYAEESAGEDAASKRRAHKPHIPLKFRQSLVQALKEAHEELLQPPDNLKDDAVKLAKWKPSVKKNISWDAVLHAQGGQVGAVVEGAGAVHSHSEHREAGGEENESPETEPEFLTIGIIGMCPDGMHPR